MAQTIKIPPFAVERFLQSGLVLSSRRFNCVFSNRFLPIGHDRASALAVGSHQCLYTCYFKAWTNLLYTPNQGQLFPKLRTTWPAWLTIRHAL